MRKQQLTKSQLSELQFDNFVSKLSKEKQKVNLDEFLSDFSLTRKKINPTNLLTIDGQKQLVNPDTNIPYFWYCCVVQKCNWDQIRLRYQKYGFQLTIIGIKQRFNKLFTDKLLLVSKEMDIYENNNLINGLKQYIKKRIVEIYDMNSYRELVGVNQIVKQCEIIIKCMTDLINNNNDQYIVRNTPIYIFFFNRQSSQEILLEENDQLQQDDFIIELENVQKDTNDNKQVREIIELENEQPNQDYSIIPFFYNSQLDQAHMTCSICYIDYEEGDYIQLIQCTHRFHVECLRDWKRVSNKCPICKYFID